MKKHMHIQSNGVRNEMMIDQLEVIIKTKMIRFGVSS
jgi:hypothetical protein